MAVGANEPQIFLFVITCISIQMVDLQGHVSSYGMLFIPAAHGAFHFIFSPKISF